MDSSKKRLLLVEDDKLTQKMTLVVLEPLGYEVHTADTGAEAIKQFKNNKYDLIFMDLGLPDTDGYTVTEEIRKLEKNLKTHTPIVALTAHIEDKFRQHAVKSGMDDFLAKPLTAKTAKNVLTKHLKKTT